jgi:choline dehydrogenase
MTGEVQDGVGYYQLTQRIFAGPPPRPPIWAPARGRANLTVRTGAQVLRIVVEKGRAVGVETPEGMIRADAEVILSSGAIGSPRLLQLSGIGPADHLRASASRSCWTSRRWGPTCRTIWTSS